MYRERVCGCCRYVTVTDNVQDDFWCSICVAEFEEAESDWKNGESGDYDGRYSL